MTTGHVFIATSLDGFIARTNHDIDWLMKIDTGDEDQGYFDFIKSVDGIVMGRGSYEKVLTFETWPYDIPVVVMSKTLTDVDIPDHLTDKISLTSLPPTALMDKLSADGWSRAYIDGGRIIQSFIKLGLIQDIIITTIPILIGDGIRMFGEIEKDIDLEHITTKSFKSGLVQNHYKLSL